MNKILKIIFLGVFLVLFTQGLNLFLSNQKLALSIQQKIGTQREVSSAIEPNTHDTLVFTEKDYTKDEVCCFLLSGLDCTVLLDGVSYSYDTFHPAQFNYASLPDTTYKIKEVYNGTQLVYVDITRN